MARAQGHEIEFSPLVRVWKGAVGRVGKKARCQPRSVSTDLETQQGAPIWLPSQATTGDVSSRGQARVVSGAVLIEIPTAVSL